MVRFVFLFFLVVVFVRKMKFYFVICLLFLSACNNPVRFTAKGSGYMKLEDRSWKDEFSTQQVIFRQPVYRILMRPKFYPLPEKNINVSANFSSSVEPVVGVRSNNVVRSAPIVIQPVAVVRSTPRLVGGGFSNRRRLQMREVISENLVPLSDRSTTINNYPQKKELQFSNDAANKVLTASVSLSNKVTKPVKQTVTETKTFKKVENIVPKKETFKPENNKITKKVLPSPKKELPKLDIVFVVDNSEGMMAFLLNVKNKFDGFVDTLSSLDWKISFVSANSNHLKRIPLERNGKLLSHPLYLTKRLKHYKSIFIDTLGFHEASKLELELYSKNKSNLVEATRRINCKLSPSCSHYSVTPLEMLRLLLEGDDQSFFRSSADLAVVIISDDDENSWTDAKDVMRSFNQAYSSKKKLKVYGITVRPEDELCRMQYGHLGWDDFDNRYGEEIFRLVSLTGGKNFSLCDKNYTPLAQKIVADF